MLPFRFYLITPGHNQARTLALFPELVRLGLRAMQIREKDLPPQELWGFCHALQASMDRLPPGPRPWLFLNHQAHMAAELGLAGVHLREDSPLLALQSPRLRGALKFGFSCHSAEGAVRAYGLGADFITCGPVFETGSKPGVAPMGLAGLKQAAGAAPVPVFALGGITPANAGDCLAAGAVGVAAISALWEAPDPLAVLRGFHSALGGL